MCLVVTCWERTDLLDLVCGVLLWVCHFPIGILGQVWYLIVSIPDICTLTNFGKDEILTGNTYVPMLPVYQSFGSEEDVLKRDVTLKSMFNDF